MATYKRFQISEAGKKFKVLKPVIKSCEEMGITLNQHLARYNSKGKITQHLFLVTIKQNEEPTIWTMQELQGLINQYGQ